MNKWDFFFLPEKKRDARDILSILCEARKYGKYICAPNADRRARFPKSFTVNEVLATAPCYQLEIYYSNKIAIYACQTCLRELRVFVEMKKKKAALRTGNLKNISVLSSAARTSRNWNASRALRYTVTWNSEKFSWLMKIFLARQPYTRPVTPCFKHSINSRWQTGTIIRTVLAPLWKSHRARSRECESISFFVFSFAPWSNYLRYLVSSDVKGRRADIQLVAERRAKERGALTGFIECSVYEWINNVGYRGPKVTSGRAPGVLWMASSPPPSVNPTDGDRMRSEKNPAAIYRGMPPPRRVFAAARRPPRSPAQLIRT